MKCRYKTYLGYWLIFNIVFLLLPAVTACRSSKISTTTTGQEAITDTWKEIISPSKIHVGCSPMERNLPSESFDLRAGARRSGPDLRAVARSSAPAAAADTTKIHITHMQQRKQTNAVSQTSNPRRGAQKFADRSNNLHNFGWLVTVAVCAAALVLYVRYLKI